MLLYELVQNLDGRSSSAAKKADAAFRTPFARRSSAISRLGSRTSAISAVACPDRAPPWISACLVQLAGDYAWRNPAWKVCGLRGQSSPVGGSAGDVEEAETGVIVSGELESTRGIRSAHHPVSGFRMRLKAFRNQMVACFPVATATRAEDRMRHLQSRARQRTLGRQAGTPDPRTRQKDSRGDTS